VTNLEIETFLAVCRHKSISKAAAEFYISQSSVSTRLRTLENELGCTLFLRHKGSREVALTAAGERFYHLSLQYQEIIRQMMTLDAKTQRLKVASINSVGTYLLPPVYERFIQTYPHIQLELQDTETELASRNILLGNTDLALTARRRDTNEIQAIPVISEPMVLICSTDPVNQSPADLKTLSARDEVYTEWFDEYVQWHQNAFGTDAVPRIRVEITGQLPLFAARKGCWAIVPRSVAEGLAASPGIQQRPMSFQVPNRIVYALCRQSKEIPEHISLFLECLRQELSVRDTHGNTLLI